jgi:hypothetical protein
MYAPARRMDEIVLMRLSMNAIDHPRKQQKGKSAKLFPFFAACAV